MTSSTGIRLRLLSDSPGDAARWQAYVSKRPDTTPYHDLRWKTILESSFRHPTRFLICEEEERIVGLLPLVVFRSRLMGRSLISLPFVDVAGVCADSDRIRDALIRGAQRIAREERAARLELRHLHPGETAVGDRTNGSVGAAACDTHKVSMRLPLCSTADEQWKALDARVRNQVRKAEKSGVTVCSGGGELLDDFYPVFARNMRDLGSPTHGRGFFENILEFLRSEARVYLARIGDTAIAGAIAITFKDEVHVPWASSAREHRSLCPNMLVYWTMIKDACDRGCGTFDFGRSSPDGGTYRFKKQWGAESAPLHWYSFSLSPSPPVSPLPSLSRSRLSRLWARLPLAIANSFGPVIRRNISL